MALVCVCGRVEPNLAGDASEIEEGSGDVRQSGKQKGSVRVATAAQQRCRRQS